jgi:hypothetical protein
MSDMNVVSFETKNQLREALGLLQSEILAILAAMKEES